MAQSPVTFRLLPKFIPEGEEDKAVVCVGQDVRTRSVAVWRREDKVVLETWQGFRQEFEAGSLASEAELEVNIGCQLVLPGTGEGATHVYLT